MKEAKIPEEILGKITLKKAEIRVLPNVQAASSMEKI